MDVLKEQVKELYSLCRDQAQFQNNQIRIVPLANRILENPEVTPQMKEVAESAMNYKLAVQTAGGPGHMYTSESENGNLVMYHPQSEAGILEGAYLDFLASISESDEDESSGFLPMHMV
jgi:hypothetical protein